MGMEVAVEDLEGFDDRVEPVEDRMRGGVSVVVVTVSPEFVRVGAGLSASSFERQLAEVRLGDLEHLIAPAGEDAAGGPRVNPLACSAVILGGIESS